MTKRTRDTRIRQAMAQAMEMNREIDEHRKATGPGPLQWHVDWRDLAERAARRATQDW